MATNDTAMTLHQGSALDAPRHEPRRLEFSSEQRQMIRDTFASGATDAEFAVLIEIARTYQLDPIKRQIFFVKRWDNDKKREVWAAQVSIDGLRAMAERTALYDGQDEPEYEYNPDGSLLLARVRIYRKDWQRPAVGVARWDEYCQKKRDGSVTSMWRQFEHTMLAKCAEALGFRKGFPDNGGGLYTPEEMSQAETRFEAQQHYVETNRAPAAMSPADIAEAARSVASAATDWTATGAELEMRLTEAASLRQIDTLSSEFSPRFKGAPGDVRGRVAALFKAARERMAAAETAVAAEPTAAE